MGQLTWPNALKELPFTKKINASSQGSPDSDTISNFCRLMFNIKWQLLGTNRFRSIGSVYKQSNGSHFSERQCRSNKDNYPNTCLELKTSLQRLN